MRCLCFVRAQTQHFINCSGFENVLLQGMAMYHVDWDLRGIHCDDEQNHLPCIEIRLDSDMLMTSGKLISYKQRKDMKSRDVYIRLR